jgi:predicted enzyme related to lactoylglutathione lyase
MTPQAALPVLLLVTRETVTIPTGGFYAWLHRRRRIVEWVPPFPLHLIEFPADDPHRARRFWTGVLGVDLVDRSVGEGEGWQTASGAPALGVHERGKGPGDTHSLPYFEVDDVDAALLRVRELGGEVIHPGARWAICRDSEGSPFGLAGPTTQA